MKIQLTFKTPNAIDDIREDVEELLGVDPRVEPECFLDEVDDQVEEIKTALEKWIRYGEYVTLEYDTEAKTLEVLEVWNQF